MIKEKTENIPVFDLSLISEELTPEAQHILDTLRDKVCYVLEYPTIEQYDDAIETLAVNMTYGFEHAEFRNFPVQYKFNKDDSNEEFKFMSYRHFIINMIMWRPQFCLDRNGFTDDLIISDIGMTKISPSLIKDYFDTHYVKKYNRYIPDMSYLAIDEINGTLSEILGETTFMLQKIMNYYSPFFGISADIETFMELAKTDPILDELMHYRLDETKQPAEMEKDVAEATDKFIKTVLKHQTDDFNKLTPLLAVKSGLNIKQFQDAVINFALKPDFDNRTFPIPVNTNLLANGGLKLLEWIYVIAITGRKAAILNNEYMGRTGHMLILIAINTADVKLSKTCFDCNTVNPVPITIHDKKWLTKLDGRRYRFRGDRQYRILDANRDEDLIGETLEFRSPATCACKDGICRECYGDLYYTNIDNEMTGIFSATTVMNPVVQGILSAKHHQTTHTTPIKFDDEFDKYFSLSSTDVVLNVDPELDASEYSIVILKDDFGVTDEDEDINARFETKKKRRHRTAKSTVESEDNYGGYDDEQEDIEQSLIYYASKFYVVKGLHDKSTEPIYYEFKDFENKELFMHNSFIDKMSSDSNKTDRFLYIDFEDIEMDETIFTVDIENNEVTRPMKAIQRLLNNKEHEGCKTYQEVINKMIELMIASGLSASAVHGEMIIRNLIRRKNNELKRPDYTKLIMSKDYELMTINSALRKNPAITTSISTPYLKYQLVNLIETFEKCGQSVFDPFFKMTLADTSDLSEIR